MLLLEKNMNGFTIYVTKPKCTCSLLSGIDWGLESLYQKSINLKFFFTSCLKILKTVKMSSWLYLGLLLFFCVSEVIFLLSVKLFCWTGVTFVWEGITIHVCVHASKCFFAIVWIWTQRQEHNIKRLHFEAAGKWSIWLEEPCHTLDDRRLPKNSFQSCRGRAGWDDLEKGDVGGQVCGVREIWRIFCMRWEIEEKLNWEKIFGMKKESPSNASNIFRVIETRLDFWCLSGSFITADGPNHKRQTFKNGVEKAVCLKITLMETPLESA